MLKKTITYEDYDGNKRTEDFYFNLNKAETIQWLTTTGDYTLDKVFQRLANERNGKEIMNIFRDFIYRSFGKKSLDGRRFDKSEEAKRDFMETEAFSILFSEIVLDAKKAAEFIKAVLPKDFTDDIDKVISENPDAIPDEYKDYIDAIKVREVK